MKYRVNLRPREKCYITVYILISTAGTDATPLQIMASHVVEVYADGTPIYSGTYTSEPATVYIPCDVNQLAFRVHQDVVSGDKGLLVHTADWITGETNSLRCASNSSLDEGHGWKYLGNICY